MNIVESTILKHFPEYSKLSNSKQIDLVQSVLLYLFRGISSTQLTAIFKTHFTSHAVLIHFRQELLNIGYLILNVKGYLYASVIDNQYMYKGTAKKVACRYKIKPEDVSLARYLMLSPKLEMLLHSYHDKGYKCLTLSGLHKGINSIVEHTHIYTAKFVNKKLRFIYQSEGMEADDFIYELLSKGTQGVLLMYPCIKSKLHAINISKQTIHNSGINIIDKYTSKRRKIIHKTENGDFCSHKISLDVLHNCKISATSLGAARTLDGKSIIYSEDTAQQISDDYDTILSIRQLIERGSPKKRTLIKLLMGEYCPDFTYWLQTKKNMRIDNVGYYNRLVGRNTVKPFIDTVMDFLGVKRQLGHQYISQIKSSLL